MAMVLYPQAPDGTRGVLTLCEGLADAAPVVVFVPAMGIRASWYRLLERPLAEQGIRLARLEWRGHGESPVRPSRRLDWGYRELVDDIAAALRTVREALPEAPVVLGGHSLGGQLGACCLALEPELARGLVTVASCSVWWRGFSGLQAGWVLGGTQLAAGLGAVLGSYPGERVGFAGHEAAGVISDWAHQARTGRYRLCGGPDVEAALSAFTTPALLLSLDGDDRMAPRSAVAHLASKLPGSQHEHVSSRALQALRRPHVEWVAESADVLARLVPFVRDCV